MVEVTEPLLTTVSWPGGLLWQALAGQLELSGIITQLASSLVLLHPGLMVFLYQGLLVTRKPGCPKSGQAYLHLPVGGSIGRMEKHFLVF